jgi:hypothetical protein
MHLKLIVSPHLTLEMSEEDQMMRAIAMSLGQNAVMSTTAPDKLRICVFYAMKTSKNACIVKSECTFTHAYCCVSKLSKIGAYLYAVDDNTSCT